MEEVPVTKNVILGVLREYDAMKVKCAEYQEKWASKTKQLEDLKTNVYLQQEERLAIDALKEKLAHVELQNRNLQIQVDEKECIQRKLNHTQVQFRQLERVAILAVDEYNRLLKNYEDMKILESVADQVFEENNELRRVGSLITTQLSGDARIAALTKELEETRLSFHDEKLHLEHKIKELHGKVDDLQDEHELRVLREKVSILESQNGILERQAEEFSAQVQEREKKIHQLEQDINQERAAKRSGIPPPPPIPVPPPLPSSALGPRKIREWIKNIGQSRNPRLPEKTGNQIEDDARVDLVKELQSRLNQRKKAARTNGGVPPSISALTDLLSEKKTSQPVEPNPFILVKLRNKDQNMNAPGRGPTCDGSITEHPIKVSKPSSMSKSDVSPNSSPTQAHPAALDGPEHERRTLTSDKCSGGDPHAIAAMFILQDCFDAKSEKESPIIEAWSSCGGDDMGDKNSETPCAFETKRASYDSARRHFQDSEQGAAPSVEPFEQENTLISGGPRAAGTSIALPIPKVSGRSTNRTDQLGTE